MLQAGEAACIKTFWTQHHRSGSQGQRGPSEPGQGWQEAVLQKWLEDDVCGCLG